MLLIILTTRNRTVVHTAAQQQDSMSTAVPELVLVNSSFRFCRYTGLHGVLEVLRRFSRLNATSNQQASKATSNISSDQRLTEPQEEKMAAWVQLASVETPDSSVCVVLGTLHERYATAKRRHASPLVFLFDSLQVAQQFMMATQTPQTKDLSSAAVPDSSPPPMRCSLDW